jgi:CheY-like chemotaxis protein
MTAPRILLVDDQRQVSRMLRASLELSGQDYSVADVA